MPHEYIGLAVLVVDVSWPTPLTVARLHREICAARLGFRVDGFFFVSFGVGNGQDIALD